MKPTPEIVVDISYDYYYISFMIYLILIFTLLPSDAWAGNLNIPTIMLTERLMLFSFVFIVGLEAWVFIKYLPKLSKKQSLLTSIKANLLTIIFTVPVVWWLWLTIILNIPESVSSVLQGKIIDNIIGAPWIGDEESLLLAEWFMAPVYFVASYYLEYWLFRIDLRDYPKEQVKKAFFFANLYSYLMIMTFETIYQLSIIPLKATNQHLW